jgi:hypothetical protein
MPSPVKRDPKVPHSISFPPFQGSLTYVRRGLELLVSSDDTRGETHTGFRVQMGGLASASLVSALLVHTPYTPYSSRGIRGKGSMISQDFGCYVDARCQMLDARSQMLDARREMRDARHQTQGSMARGDDGWKTITDRPPSSNTVRLKGSKWRESVKIPTIAVGE